MKSRNPSFIALLLLAVLGASISRALPANVNEPTAATRLLGIDDLFQLNAVSDPQLNPEGDWIAYVITPQDLQKDESLSRVWIVPAGWRQQHDCQDASQLTALEPDGRYWRFCRPGTTARPGVASVPQWRRSRTVDRHRTVGRRIFMVAGQPPDAADIAGSD
ncbi:MAG: hypothetical protein IPJ33_14540 [Gammaproteobacteria bacterium]|nr:hypothetical protein [Gammaproteobacteria bacterium]